jgi:hypothetical protein
MIHGLSSCLPLFVFAARQGPEGVWGRFDHQKATFGKFELIILGAVVLLLAGTLVWQWIGRRPPRDFRCNSPSRLFGDLCRAHRLDRSSRRLLKQLASQCDARSPAELFVEPAFFDTANIPSALKASARELRQLRHKLFD